MSKNRNNLLALRYLGDPILRQKAQPIEEITEEIRAFAENLVYSMVHYDGVGLAATQVGKLLRIFVIRDEVILPDGSYRFGAPEILINPVITEPSQETSVMTEGCLSIPGLHCDVTRPASIHVRYQKLDGSMIEERVSGFRARVMMHENDHLNGVLYIDRLTAFDKKKIGSKLQAIKKKYKNFTL